MADTYLILVIILFALAIFDLVVGVSNDAVNFLTSAIGSKVARRRTVMFVASIGIFIGAAFSSGMMEVARKGVFHPGAFSFEEIMVVFLAVMITDIILLDLFNTFGLPTSTTVSIVFELLGSSVAIALIKLTDADQGLGHLSAFINWENALEIVTGILLSVVVAFTLGSLLMYLSRLLFTFQYKKKLAFVAPLWSSVALTAMSYFLLGKGLKNASFIPDEAFEFVNDNLLLFLAGVFGFWVVVTLVLSNLTKFDILRFAVLFGTFGLAMAFAGNDLVNFIGVPIAGFQSYQHWVAEGSPEGLSMTFLEEKVTTEPYLLFIAGAVMVATLLLSKKARSVTDTTVKLGRQDEGAERFKANAFARSIVLGSQAVNGVFRSLLPPGLLSRINKSFEPAPPEPSKDGEEGPAFDLIRATVNLAVAAMIISYASSRKLPLSTTYVSFMVAMGASLADRAWGRDSAVYRIAGVTNVILGWFGTALIAFTLSAIFAFFIYQFQIYGIAALMLLAVGLVLRSNLVHKRKEAKFSRSTAEEVKRSKLTSADVESQIRSKALTSFAGVRKTVHASLEGLLSEDKAQLKAASRDMAELKDANEAFRFSLYHFLKRIPKDDLRAAKVYLSIYDLEQDLAQSAQFINDACLKHVRNIHSPLAAEQVEQVRQLQKEVDAYLELVADSLASGEVDADRLQVVVTSKNDILSYLDKILEAQAIGIQDEEYNSRNSLLNFSLVFEVKDLAAISARFVKLFHRNKSLGDPDKMAPAPPQDK